MRIRMIVGAAAAAALLAPAAQAQAATLAVNAPCYIEGTPVTAGGTGFTPAGPVAFTFDGLAGGSGDADPAGNFTQPLVAPTLPGGTFQHTYTLTAQDQANPALAASTAVTVTKLAADLRPRRARPSRKVKFIVHGMPPGRTVYLHYVFHGHVKATRRIGKPKAPCGTLTKRQRFFPMRHPKFGTWKFQFDNKKRYRAATTPRIAGPVTVFRILHH